MAAARRLLPATDMTIGGVVKHLAHMEDLWFTHKLLGRAFPPPFTATGLDEEWAWTSAAGDTVAALDVIQEVGKQSTAELGRVLHLLRFSSSDHAPGPSSTRPGLADLDALLEKAAGPASPSAPVGS